MTIHFKKISLAGSDTNKLNESLVEPKPHLYVVGTLTSVNQQTTKLAARQTNRLLTPRFADSMLGQYELNCARRRFFF